MHLTDDPDMPREHWLVEVLLPAVLAAADIVLADRPACPALRLRADIREWESWRDGGYWAAGRAQDMLDEHPVIELAFTACQIAGETPAAIDARDAISLVMGAVALELAYISNLISDILAVAMPSAEETQREADAEAAFARFTIA